MPIRLFNPYCLAFVFCTVATAAASAQKAAPVPADIPTVECKPPIAVGFRDLRIFQGTQPVLLAFHCGEPNTSQGTCHAGLLDPLKPELYQGDLIAPGQTQGRWTCAMVGGWFGYVPSDRLAPVPATPAITTRQWIGTWADSHPASTGNRLVLTRSAVGGGIVHVEGQAQYTNAAHNTSTGSVSEDAIAYGPYLHILDHAEQPGCVLDLKFDPATNTLRAVDNQQCGGFNVTFDGTYHRSHSLSGTP